MLVEQVPQIGLRVLRVEVLGLWKVIIPNVSATPQFNCTYTQVGKIRECVVERFVSQRDS
jgi:hypothetical protein